MYIYKQINNMTTRPALGSIWKKWETKYAE